MWSTSWSRYVVRGCGDIARAICVVSENINHPLSTGPSKRDDISAGTVPDNILCCCVPYSGIGSGVFR